jgi:PKD repeat protein
MGASMAATKRIQALRFWPQATCVLIPRRALWPARANCGRAPLLLALVALIGITCERVARADGMAPIFGPKEYARTTGPPEQFTDSFQNCETAAQYELVVQNGHADGSGRVSSASVVLNGVVVVSPNEFNQQVPGITRPVAIGSKNQLAVQLASKPGDSITVSVQCIAACLGVQITNPTPSILTVSRVLVSGTIASTADEVGVGVNGIAALAQGQQFVANGIPIVSGTNLLVATATNACGNQATSTVEVMGGTLTPPAVTVRVTPNSGVAPLSVTISTEVASPSPIANYQWDFTSDGTVDASGPNAATVTTTYTQPGVFVAQVTATDSMGGHATGQIPILVLSPAAITSLLQGRWKGFSTALTAQDVQGAMSFISSSAADQFKQVFATLAKQLPQIGSTLGPITLVSITGGIAEFVTTRNQQGTAATYVMTFMQDTNGLWKIVAM